MANNVITAVIPKILAQGLVALRQNSVTPRLVANMTSSIAGVKGSTIDVPIASAITAVAVTPATTAPAAAAISPTTVPVVLDQWYEAPFDLSDNEYEQAMDGIVPLQVQEAIKAICNQVDNHLLSMYKKFYGYHGTAGTTPFANVDTGISDAVGIRKVLNKQLAPMDARNVILSAGSLGTPEILLRSEMKGLWLSPKVGTQFSGNGDFFAMAYNADHQLNTMGFGKDPNHK